MLSVGIVEYIPGSSGLVHNMVMWVVYNDSYIVIMV